MIIYTAGKILRFDRAANPIAEADAHEAELAGCCERISPTEIRILKAVALRRVPVFIPSFPLEIADVVRNGRRDASQHGPFGKIRF